MFNLKWPFGQSSNPRRRLGERKPPIITKHGHSIIEYQIVVDGDAFGGNFREHMGQPRVRQLAKEMEGPLLNGIYGDRIVIDEATGFFYLKSKFDELGPNAAPALGQVDLDWEEPLIVHAYESILGSALCRTTGHVGWNSPVIIDRSGNIRDVRRMSEETKREVEMDLLHCLMTREEDRRPRSYIWHGIGLLLLLAALQQMASNDGSEKPDTGQLNKPASTLVTHLRASLS